MSAATDDDDWLEIAKLISDEEQRMLNEAEEAPFLGRRFAVAAIETFSERVLTALVLWHAAKETKSAVPPRASR
jgi:hypothetical protein